MGGKNPPFLVQHPYRFGNIPYPKTDSFAMPSHAKIGACKPEGDATRNQLTTNRPTCGTHLVGYDFQQIFAKNDLRSAFFFP